jgi:hypothetical protein
MKKAKKNFRVGDLIACYTSEEQLKIVVGWITKKFKNSKKATVYMVRWSDIDDNDPTRINAPFDEAGVEMCYNLLQKAIELDIWEGKKIL